MWQNSVDGILEWSRANGGSLAGSYPHVAAALALFGMIAAVLVLYSYKESRLIAAEGLFDKALWEQVLSLVYQNRIHEAAALCASSEGAFPRLYKIGLESALDGTVLSSSRTPISPRENAAEQMAELRQECQNRLCRYLGALTVISFAAPFIGLCATSASAWAAYQNGSLSVAIGLVRLLPPLASTLAGMALAALAGAFYAYFALRVRKLSAQMNFCSLKLIMTLFDRVVNSRPVLKVAPLAHVAPREPARPEPALVGAAAGKPAFAPAPAKLPVPVVPAKPTPSREEISVWDNLGHHHL